MNCIGMSKMGLVRKKNEDRFVIDDNLYIVTDGMGGYTGGEIASTYAIDEIRRLIQDADQVDSETLVQAIQR